MSSQPFSDEEFPVLPPESEPPDADEALSLQDALADSDDLDVDQDPPVPLGRTPAIDFVQRTFVPNTAGGPLMLYGDESLRQWIEKCLRTRRGDSPAVHPDFGLDALIFDLVDGGIFDESAAAEYQAIVERALPVHPAIASVDEFDVDYSDGDDAATARIVVAKVAEGEDPLELDLSIPIGD